MFRLPKNAYINVWARVEKGETDFIIDFKGKPVRVIALKLNTGEIEVLLTSLPDEMWSWTEIGKLYALRWYIEECYKRLKIPAEIENFSGKNVEAILQEYWAYLVMCNILATHMSDVQAPWNPEAIPKYRLNFTVLFGSTRDRLRDVLQGRCSPEEFQQLFERVSIRAKVKIRPGRKFSRDKAGVPKRHHVFRRAC